MNWYKTAQATGWQDGWEEALGDVQRYIYDSYTARVHITKLANKQITISVLLYMYQSGSSIYQDFWRFGPEEKTAAMKTYHQVTKTVDKVFNEFRTNDIPNLLIYTHLREELRDIDPDRKPKSRIPHVDWARNKPMETDWRNSLYGNRYPKNIDGF